MFLKGPSTGNQLIVVCSENCSGGGNSQLLLKNLSPGNYTVIVEESNGSSGQCKAEKTVYVPGSNLVGTADSRSALTSSANNLAELRLELEVEEAIIPSIEDAIDFEIVPASTTQSLVDSKEVRLFPNPVQEELSIDLQAFAGKPSTILIVNQLGAVVQNLEIDELPNNLITVDLSTQANGLYFMQASIDGELITKKFMISRR